MTSPNKHLADFEFDLATDDLYPLGELSEQINYRRKGKKLHKSYAYRCKDGRMASDGSIVPLPTLNIGGITCTSNRAFAWWCQRLSAGGGTPTASQAAGARGKAAERAALELEAAGI